MTPPRGRGRPQGSKNKASRTLRQALHALKFDLADEFINLYRSDDLDAAGRLRLLSTLLEYTHSKLTPVAAAPEDDDDAESPASELPSDAVIVALKAQG